MLQYFLVFLILVQVVNLAQLTHYDVLGVSRDASQQEIRSAYKKLAIKLHPDKNPDAAQNKQFLRVSEAYETLRDARRRRLYDGWGGLDPQDVQRGLYADDPHVVTLTGHDYEARLAEGMHFVNFYSPACAPCRRLAPAWSRLAELYEDVVHFSAVNCRAQAHFCHNTMRIGSYPTLLFYPNGRAGNFMYYNGALEAAALEQFLSRVVAERAPAPPAPPAARLRPAAPAPLLYLLAAWRFEDGAPHRLAYRLRGIATVLVVEDEELRAQLSPDARVTAVLQAGAARAPLLAAERALPAAAAAALPPPLQLAPGDIQEIRSSLRSGTRRAHALHLRGGDGGAGSEGGGGGAGALELRRLQAELPELDFGEINCTRWAALCAALQVPAGSRWAVLKVGGAYQAAPPAPGPAPAPAAFLRRAAPLRNLHSLSDTEYRRILDGESGGDWLVGVSRGAALLEPLLAAAERYRHRDDLQLGLLQCAAGAASGPCARRDGLVLLQRAARRHELPAPAGDQEVLEFLDLLMDDPVEYLTEELAMEISSSADRPSWLVAWLPRICSPDCARAAHRWRLLARTLRPLKGVRVGLLDCGAAKAGPGAGQGEGAGGVCGNVRAPTARLYRAEDNQVYGTSLLELGAAWRAAQWAVELLRAPVRTLSAPPDDSDPAPWLLYFHSPRCARCHELYPDFAVASMVLAGRVKAGRINCLESRALCQRERITSYPSIKLYRRGGASAVPVADAARILEALEPMLPRHRHDEF